MKLAKENLGKVSVTVEKAYHSVDKEYDKLVVVEEEGQFRTFISRKPVPIGTELTDREYWLPFSSIKESIVIDYNKFKQYIRTGEGLLDDSIVERHIKNRSVTGNKIAENTITFINIVDKTITLNKINDKAIDTTLTKEGYLAEAKHTGDRLLNIEGLSVVKVSSTQSTVLDAWQLIDKKGNIHGVTINTYKDKNIDAIWLSVNEDDSKPENPEVKVDNPKYLNIIYNKANGTQQKVSIPLSSFVTEAEFSKNGFKVIDGVVNLKISSDITTSRYFHFDADGNITLDGFEERLLEDLGTIDNSVVDDGTMWGQYKKEEGTKDSFINEASRWGQYKQAEADRNELLNTVSSKVNQLEQEQIQGGVYDISAHNSNIVFESIQALLNSSDLSTLIPISVRHGGMTIRFIQGSEQSSDHKYVQYCYISTSTANANFTNIANWQGVDDVPTEGSNNMVKSAGVYDKVLREQNYVPDKKINSFGTIVDSIGTGDFISTKIPLATNDTLYWKYAPDSNFFGFVDVFDESDTLLANWQGNNGANGERTVNITTPNAAYIIVSFSGADGYKPLVKINNVVVWDGKHEKQGIPKLQQEIDSINEIIENIDEEPTTESVNLVKSGGIANKLLNNFFVGQGQNYNATRIDGIAPGTKIRVFTFSQTWECNNRYGYIFLIESYNGTSYTSLAGTVIPQGSQFPTIPPYYDVTIPADSQYIRVGGRAEVGVKVKFIIALLTTFKSGEYPVDISLDKIISQGNVNLPTSKAVGKQLLNSYFICNGDNDFSGIDIQAAPGNTYRVFMCEDWDASIYTGTYTKLSMGYYNQNNQYIPVFTRFIKEWSLPAYADVTIPSDAKPLIRIQGRGNVNEIVKFMIANISVALEEDIFQRTSMYDTLPVKEIAPSLSVGSISIDYDSNIYDCLCDFNYYKVTPNAKVYIIRASDISVRIIEYDENKAYIKYSQYAKISTFIVGSTTRFIRISAYYTERGFSSSNRITLNDFHDGDFGLYYKCIDTDDVFVADKYPTINSPRVLSSGVIRKNLDAIVDGQEGNYYVNKAFNINGELFTKSGWGAFKEDIPCTAGYNVVVWNCGRDASNSAYLVFLNSNKEKISAYTANELSRLLTAPADTAYLRCCFALTKSDDSFNQKPLYIRDIEYQRVETIPSLNALNESIKVLQEVDAHRLSYIRGRYNYDGVLISITMNTTYPGWYLSEDYIPVSFGNTVIWNFGAYSPGGNSCCLIMYNSNKEFVKYFGANDDAGTRNITIPSDVAYIRVSFYETFNNQPNTVPVIVDDVKYFIDDISKLNNHDSILFPTVSDFGIIGDSYPEEVVEIEKYLKYKRTTDFNRLHFLHVSDNHNYSFGNAQNFLDYCPAQFLINTGDMVNDKFADGAANTIALAIAPTKPVYLVVGNHDVSHATSNQAIYDYFFGNSETNGTINHHNSVAGGVVAEHTYYNVDFATEKVKCIMLDMNDGWSDTELQDLSPYPATLGKMSQTQINWFVTQLQDAITNGYHVCVFIHTLSYNVDMKERILNFCDVGSDASVNSVLTFLPNIIDAFISGSSVSFDYNGNSYSFTFASVGHFIAWFCGHTHYDMGGWMEAHTNQFMINVCQPFNTDSAKVLGSYDEDELGVHFNFYTIDTNVKSLSVYRVGQQKTIYATERKCYRINYK